MTDIMTLGGNSLRSFSRGIATVSDNIGNAQQPGYARRSVTLENDRVIRHADDWRESEARISSGLSAQASVRLDWLQSAETAINDGESGVGQRVGAVFNMAGELAADPGNTARRTAFLQSVDDAALAFRTTAEGLKTASSGIATQAEQAVFTINTQMEALKDLNRTLLATPGGTSTHATLLDQRDRLLAGISEGIGVDIALDGRGIATVSLSGSGENLVSVAGAGTISLSILADGKLGFTATAIDGVSTGFSPVSGALAGLGSAATDIAAKRAELDGLASRFADFLNTAQVNGRTNAGVPGNDMLALGSEGALTLAALDIGPADLALADMTSDNGNALAMVNARASSGVEAGWMLLVTDHAQRVSSARLLDETARARSDAAAQGRDEASGVDLDREAAELLRFQQSYDAAARVLQAARDMLQSILNIVR